MFLDRHHSAAGVRMIPFWIKPVIALLVILGLSGGMYLYGRKAQEHADQLIFDKMRIAALSQQTAAQQKEKEQNENTYQVAQIYSADHDKLQRALGRLLHPGTPAAGSAVPSVAVSAGSIDAAEPEFGRTCTSAFYAHALEDAQNLSAWQDWAKREGIPVVQLIPH